jgi:ferredoxin-type protein NapG
LRLFMTQNKIAKVSPAHDASRRSFLRALMLTGGVAGVSLLGYIPVITQRTDRLRPPGALAEKSFLSSCIKCGQCVQVCPVEAIKLSDITDGFGIGTPYIAARDQACDFSCDGLQCVLACPTGALTHEIDYPHQAEMAKAKLVRPDTCLAVLGLGVKGKARETGFEGKLRYAEIDRWTPILLNDYDYDLEICDLCVRQCPIEQRIAQCADGNPPSGNEKQCPPNPAIRLIEINSVDGQARFKPQVLDGCTGCGVCEMVCPAEQSAIVMESLETGALI